MLALAEYRRRLGPCGHYLPDTTSPEAEGGFTADEPTRCHACLAVSEAAVSYKDDPHQSSLYFQPARR